MAARKKTAAGDAAGTTGDRRVRATQTGYYDHVIRNPGDVFIQNDAISPFSKKWMEDVDPNTPERVTGSNDVIREEHDRIMRERTAGGGVGPDVAGTTAGKSTGDADPLSDA